MECNCCEGEVVTSMGQTWFSVDSIQPSGSPIVLMYSKDNNEFSVGHFTLSRADVPVTHWQWLIAPSSK